MLTPIEERRAIWATVPDEVPPAVLDDWWPGRSAWTAWTRRPTDVLAARVRGRVLVRPPA